MKLMFLVSEVTNPSSKQGVELITPGKQGVELTTPPLLLILTLWPNTLLDFTKDTNRKL